MKSASIADAAVLRVASCALGRSFRASYLDLVASQQRTEVEARRRTEQALARILQHAAEHVPTYRDWYRERGLASGRLGSPADLRQLPITRKTDLQTAPDRYIADNIPAERRIKAATSGSTGAPLHVYWDRTAIPGLIANHLFADIWYGFGPLERNVKFRTPRSDVVEERARLPSIIRLRDGVIGSLRRIFEDRTQLKVSTLEIGPAWAEITYRRMEAFRPKFVSGYTSAIANTASELLQLGLRLSRPVQHVITEAEPLTAERRRAIEQFFGSPVGNRYGLREQGAFTALSCPEYPDRMHILTEYCWMEVIREDGAVAAPGEAGRLLVTDLRNFAMPLIRYDTGDLAIAGDTCPCGRSLPVIRNIEGRSTECLRTPSGRVISPVLLGMYLFVNCGHTDAMRQYQLIQTAADQVTLLVAPGPAFPARRETILHDLQELTEHAMMVRIETVAGIAAERSGKRPLIKILCPTH